MSAELARCENCDPIRRMTCTTILRTSVDAERATEEIYGRDLGVSDETAGEILDKVSTGIDGIRQITYESLRLSGCELPEEQIDQNIMLIKD